MTGLECLDRIDKKNYLTEREHKEFLGVIKKELKALDVIRMIFNKSIFNAIKLKKLFDEGWITKEQFDLLYEVLK